MPVTVATLRAIIGLDDSDFQAGLQKTKKGVRELSGDMQTLSGFVTGMGASLTAGVTLPIVALGVASIKSATDMDSLKRGLLAVAGSTQEADRQLRSLKEVAKLPGLGFEDAVKGSVNLQAAGFSANLAERALSAFGNALATVGKGKADLDGVSLALTQLSNKTTGFGQDIRQLQERLPQTRQMLLKVFGTADTEAIGKMGVTGKQVVELLTREFEKLPKVTGGVGNAFENLDDAMKQAFATIGESALPALVPILNATGDAVTYVAHVFAILPDPIKGVYVGFAAIVAGAGPLLLIVGGVSTAVLNSVKAWEALAAIKAGVVAAEAATTAAVVTETAAVVGETEALAANAVAAEADAAAQATAGAAATAAAGGFNLAKIAIAGAGFALTRIVPVVAAVTVGWTAGTIIMDSWVGGLEKQAKATDDATEAMRKSRPFLEQLIAKETELMEVRTAANNTGRDYANSAYYQRLQKQVADLRKQYTEAQELMAKGFNRAEVEASLSLEKMNAKFKEALEKAQTGLNELKAPTLELKLKAQFKDPLSGKTITDEQAKALAGIERQTEATKKLEEAQKHAAEERARSVKSFREEIDQTRREVEALRAGTTYAGVRAKAPVGTPDSLIREMSALEDQRKALEKAKTQREEETRKIKELTDRLKELGTAASGTSAAVRTAARGIPAAVPGRVVPGGGPIPIVNPYASGGGARVPGMPVVTHDKLGPIWNGPPLPPVGPTTQYSSALAAVATQAKAAAVAHEPLNRQIAELKAQIKQAEFIRAFGESWNAARIEFLKSKATTDEQRIALETLKRSFDTLSPTLKARVHEMANWRREQESTKQAQDATKAALEEETKAYEEGVKVAADAHKQFTDSLKTALGEARGKLLESTAATEGEKVALGLLSDRVRELPDNIRTAAAAFAYLSKNFAADTEAARKAGDEIAAINAKLEKPKESTPEWLKDLLKDLEDMKKAAADFNKDTAERIASARRRMAVAPDTAQNAWLDFLSKNEKLANALANGLENAAEAQEKFKTALEAERLADATDKLRQMQEEANRAYREASGPVDTYTEILSQLGLSATDVSGRLDGMIKKIVETREETKRVNEVKDLLKGVASDLQGVFENAFNDLREHGFKGFFDSIVQGFEEMLSRMAAQFLASQLMQLISGVIGNVLGGLAGGGGKGAAGAVGDFPTGGPAMAAAGGPAVYGRPMIVGEKGPELFVPGGSGRIVANHELGGGTVVYSPTYNIQTPDANSFRRSQGQLLEDGYRHLNTMSRRNGRRGQLER
jgi:tape measure domain-containing protein